MTFRRINSRAQVHHQFDKVCLWFATSFRDLRVYSSIALLRAKFKQVFFAINPIQFFGQFFLFFQFWFLSLFTHLVTLFSSELPFFRKGLPAPLRHQVALPCRSPHRSRSCDCWRHDLFIAQFLLVLWKFKLIFLKDFVIFFENFATKNTSLFQFDLFYLFQFCGCGLPCTPLGMWPSASLAAIKPHFVLPMSF